MQNFTNAANLLVTVAVCDKQVKMVLSMFGFTLAKVYQWERV